MYLLIVWKIFLHNIEYVAINDLHRIMVISGLSLNKKPLNKLHSIELEDAIKLSQLNAIKCELK